MYFGELYNKGQKVLSSQQNLGEVWISGYDFAHNIQELQKNKIYAVCSGVDLSFKYPQKFRYIKFDLDDCAAQKVQHVFDPAFNFIQEQRKKTNVLVNCAAGISRCSVILISYMIKKYRWDYDTCLEKVQNARSICQPNSGFVKQLRQLQKSLGIPENQRAKRNDIW